MSGLGGDYLRISQINTFDDFIDILSSFTEDSSNCPKLITLIGHIDVQDEHGWRYKKTAVNPFRGANAHPCI